VLHWFQEIDAAVKWCATSLGLARDTAHLKTFTSKSLRCGIAAQSSRRLSLPMGVPSVALEESTYGRCID
jgi:hypothetical protein